MREINNNAAGLNKATYQKPEQKKETQPVVEPQQEQTAVTTSETLSKSPEAIIGRSQIIDVKAKTATLNEVEKDVKMMLENPEIAENYNKTFDTVFKVLQQKGDKEAYEKAACIAQELCS